MNANNSRFEVSEGGLILPRHCRRQFLEWAGTALLAGATAPLWTMRDAIAASRCSNLEVVGQASKHSALVNRIPIKVNGKDYFNNEIAESWAKQCRWLPCFHGVCWKGYAERVIKNVQVGNRYLIVHLWKGYCNKFLWNNDFPGGIGAEVGVYLVQPDSWIDMHKGEVATALDMADSIINPNSYYKKALEIPNPHKWFPAWELDISMRFKLIDPETNQTVIETKEKPGYWCTEWLELDAYQEWERCRGGKIDGTHLTLQYWINGVKQKDWEYQKDKDRDDYWCRPGRGYSGDWGPLGDG